MSARLAVFFGTLMMMFLVFLAGVGFGEVAKPSEPLGITHFILGFFFLWVASFLAPNSFLASTNVSTEALG